MIEKLKKLIVEIADQHESAISCGEWEMGYHKASMDFKEKLEQILSEEGEL